MEKITKQQLVARVRKLQADEVLKVAICPCKVRPNPHGMADFSIKVAFTRNDLELEGNNSNVTKMDACLNMAWYYNCNNGLGKYLHYYIAD